MVLLLKLTSPRHKQVEAQDSSPLFGTSDITAVPSFGLQYRKDIDKLERVQGKFPRLWDWSACPVRTIWGIWAWSAWSRVGFGGNLRAFCKSLIRGVVWWEGTNITTTQETWLCSREIFNSEGSQKMGWCLENLQSLHPQRWLRPRWTHAGKIQCNTESGCVLGRVGSGCALRKVGSDDP